MYYSTPAQLGSVGRLRRCASSAVAPIRRLVSKHLKQNLAGNWSDWVVIHQLVVREDVLAASSKLDQAYKIILISADSVGFSETV